jgi:hypothetical protein
MGRTAIDHIHRPPFILMDINVRTGGQVTRDRLDNGILPCMNAVLASLIAVIGTLLGSAITYLFQQRTAERHESRYGTCSSGIRMLLTSGQHGTRRRASARQ